jgi:prepilin signal peptidase PulO-like enzyme (type II secretory pathway)
MDPKFLSIMIVFAFIEGITAGFSSIFVFNRIPAKWLCDYGVVPGKEMWGERISKKPWIWLLPLIFFAAAILLIRQGPTYQVAALLALWILLQIGMADQKYMIIPDQFVIALAVTALGFLPTQSEFLPLVLGALIGGGSFLLAGLIGKLVFRKEAVGFGDVKLLAALGLVTGTTGIIAILILTVFSSAIVFGCLLIAGLLRKEEERPLGPFIAASAAVVLLLPVETASVIGWFFPFV